MEIRNNEEHMDRVIVEFNQKRATLEASTRELSEIERNVDDLKLRNREMRTT